MNEDREVKKTRKPHRCEWCYLTKQDRIDGEADDARHDF